MCYRPWMFSLSLTGTLKCALAGEEPGLRGASLPGAPHQRGQSPALGQDATLCPAGVGGGEAGGQVPESNAPITFCQVNWEGDCSVPLPRGERVTKETSPHALPSAATWGFPSFCHFPPSLPPPFPPASPWRLRLPSAPLLCTPFSLPSLVTFRGLWGAAEVTAELSAKNVPFPEGLIVI